MYYRRSNNIMDEIRDSFRKGSALTKLIYINLGVFISVKLAFMFFFLVNASYHSYMEKEMAFRGNILRYFMISSDLNELLYRPWTPITYMFLHEGFLHILFNLLVLFWFGRIFLQYLNEKQLITTYLLGGLSGGFLFVLSYNIFPGLSLGYALGASAAIMAVVLSISIYHPDYSIYVPFLGPVKIKYIAMVYIVLDVLQIASENAGGHIAHLGGALYGYLFAIQLKKGKDMGKGFSRFVDSLASLFKRRSKLKVTYKNQAKNLSDEDYNQQKAEAQKEIDKILDKIAQSGYDSLTKKEKETLFKMSGKK